MMIEGEEEEEKGFQSIMMTNFVCCWSAVCCCNNPQVSIPNSLSVAAAADRVFSHIGILVPRVVSKDSTLVLNIAITLVTK